MAVENDVAPAVMVRAKSVKRSNKLRENVVFILKFRFNIIVYHKNMMMSSRTRKAGSTMFPTGFGEMNLLLKTLAANQTKAE